MTPPRACFPAHNGCLTPANWTPIHTWHTPISFWKPSCSSTSQQVLSSLGFYKTLMLEQRRAKDLLCFGCMWAPVHVFSYLSRVWRQWACKTPGWGPSIPQLGILTVPASEDNLHQSRCLRSAFKWTQDLFQHLLMHLFLPVFCLPALHVPMTDQSPHSPSVRLLSCPLSPQSRTDTGATMELLSWFFLEPWCGAGFKVQHLNVQNPRAVRYPCVSGRAQG